MSIYLISAILFLQPHFLLSIIAKMFFKLIFIKAIRLRSCHIFVFFETFYLYLFLIGNWFFNVRSLTVLFFLNYSCSFLNFSLSCFYNFSFSSLLNLSCCSLNCLFSNWCYVKMFSSLKLFFWYICKLLFNQSRTNINHFIHTQQKNKFSIIT